MAKKRKNVAAKKAAPAKKTAVKKTAVKKSIAAKKGTATKKGVAAKKKRPSSRTGSEPEVVIEMRSSSAPTGGSLDETAGPHTIGGGPHTITPPAGKTIKNVRVTRTGQTVQLDVELD